MRSQNFSFHMLWDRGFMRARIVTRKKVCCGSGAGERRLIEPVAPLLIEALGVLVSTP
jgi:hypothetical protein